MKTYLLSGILGISGIQATTLIDAPSDETIKLILQTLVAIFSIIAPLFANRKKRKTAQKEAEILKAKKKDGEYLDIEK